jgi:hypothetical protein
VPLPTEPMHPLRCKCRWLQLHDWRQRSCWVIVLGDRVGCIDPFYFYQYKGGSCNMTNRTSTQGSSLQCQDLPTGAWLSLQQNGQCRSGQHVHAASPPPTGCAWEQLDDEGVTTITYECLTQQGFFNHCNSSKLVPGVGCVFEAASKVLVQALRKCPNVTAALGLCFE